MVAESVRNRAEDRPEIHDEIARLPEKYREPIVLCYLEGLSVEVAAQSLGCPEGTVLSRLARARERLRRGLTRRGLALPAVFMAAGLTPRSAAALPPGSSRRQHRPRCGSRLARGWLPQPRALAKGTLRAMLMTKSTLAASVMTVGVAAGTAWVVHRPVNVPPAPQPVPSAIQVNRAWYDSTEQRVANLKALGVALHDFHDASGRLPPQAIVGKEGQPLLSWRVAVLPFLAQRELYARFRLDEPWNSPHNKVAHSHDAADIRPGRRGQERGGIDLLPGVRGSGDCVRGRRRGRILGHP